jgi:hypothetical protein
MAGKDARAFEAPGIECLGIRDIDISIDRIHRYGV